MHTLTNNLWITSLTPEQHKRTCNYWWTVTSNTSPHTAFQTIAELNAWLDLYELRIDGVLPKLGTWASFPIVGSYHKIFTMERPDNYEQEIIGCSNSYMSVGYFYHHQKDGKPVHHTINCNSPHIQYLDHWAAKDRMHAGNLFCNGMERITKAEQRARLMDGRKDLYAIPTP